MTDSRMARVRFPEQATVNDWSQGVPLAKAAALIEAWRSGDDWRSFERRVNQLPRFLLIHFGELDRGGHFAAMEQPALFTSDCGKRSSRCDGDIAPARVAACRRDLHSSSNRAGARAFS